MRISKPLLRNNMIQQCKSFIGILSLILLLSCSSKDKEHDLIVDFNGLYGQIEIGGKYVGIEFHKSRPLPSRISFYYPVANSIDLSTDYWQRDQSLPLNLILKSNSGMDTLGLNPLPYRYTPYRIQFDEKKDDLKISYSYDVCDDLPLLVLRIALKNMSIQSQTISLLSQFDMRIRTSHSYQWIDSDSIRFNNKRTTAIANFERQDADSTAIFIANSGLLPEDGFLEYENMQENPRVNFAYQYQIDAGEEIEIIQLIGSCRIRETENMINQSMRSWKESIIKNRDRVLNYTFDQDFFYIDDPALQQTVYWSKAILASNIHYIDHSFLPMPCPAEYNFFFTHDLLLTSLGAVNFDTDYVRNGFQFLHSLTQQDSILAHAYYWKDGQFVTEYCNSDNWNHLWFIIVASAYLKHSGDFKTLESIYPVLYKSLHMMLKNKGENDLMNAKRPDWWDIGNIYGPRVYITALMSRALVDYVYIAASLDKEHRLLPDLQALSLRMQKQLVKTFWDEENQFLFNMMDETSVDKHYYAGSLIAAYYGNIDAEHRSRLLKTAKDTLLDPHIGLRNAMPPDFDQLITEYKFSGLECGLPYVYFNGGVWPHNNAWYALALLADNQADEAQNVLKKYMTLEGIRNSPNGQYSFYEYRRTDPNSQRYGEIDKPTFLWAGGWFLHVLYQLAGIRDNSWNIAFSPRLPDGFGSVEYDLIIGGGKSRIQWKGSGNHFSRILIDGKTAYSAVMTSSAKNIILERGLPDSPYLADANAAVDQVNYLTEKKILSVHFRGFTGQRTELEVISPYPVQSAELNGSVSLDPLFVLDPEQIYRYTISTVNLTDKNEVLLYF